jgi:hypothetical protein
MAGRSRRPSNPARGAGSAIAIAFGAGVVAVAVGGAVELSRATESGHPRVLVATTGNHSEQRTTVPITDRAKAKKRVAMSLGPHKLPELASGDRLVVSAELQVTVDCFRPDPACVGRPYRLNPRVGSRLVLARRPGITGGEQARPISGRRVISCHGEPLSDRQHHCVLVFEHASLPVRHRKALPCDPGACFVNFVLDAHSHGARRGDRLIIGANKPNGRVLQDKGRINVIRLRPGHQPAPTILKTTERRHASVPLDQRPTVVLSRRLRHLKQNAQLAVLAKMRADVSRLPYSARVTTHLILARTPHATATTRWVAHLASLRGEIAETNGSNCTRRQTPCPYTKVGVLRMLHDATNRAGNGIPLYVNLYVVSNPKRAHQRRADTHLRVLRDAKMKVARYRPALRG